MAFLLTTECYELHVHVDIPHLCQSGINICTNTLQPFFPKNVFFSILLYCWSLSFHRHAFSNAFNRNMNTKRFCKLRIFKSKFQLNFPINRFIKKKHIQTAVKVKIKLTVVYANCTIEYLRHQNKNKKHI